jgi:hypothetical protein
MNETERKYIAFLIILFYLQIAHIQTYILRKRKVSN